MMLTFYKGSALTQTTTAATSSPASSSGGHIRQQAGEHGTVRWVLGSVSMLANVVGFALWLLLQRKFTRKYPAVYSATAFMSLFSFVQAGALALSIQRTSLAVWALRGTVEIATVVYCVRSRTHVLSSLSHACTLQTASRWRTQNVCLTFLVRARAGRSGVWHWVPPAHLLRGEERPRVHCRLQPARPDLRRRHRSLHPPRASLPRKVMMRPQRNAAHRSTHHSLLAHMNILSS